MQHLGKKASVFEAANIREWRGHDVVDAEGHKIGELEAVYVDTGTDLPSFATVKVGMPTRHRLVFVPLEQATVGPAYLKVCFGKKQVKDAPSIGTDGELPAGDEEAIFKHYGLTYQPGAGGERRLARR
jgi:PRC-barrel domain